MRNQVQWLSFICCLTHARENGYNSRARTRAQCLNASIRTYRRPRVSVNRMSSGDAVSPPFHPFAPFVSGGFFLVAGRCSNFYLEAVLRLAVRNSGLSWMVASLVAVHHGWNTSACALEMPGVGRIVNGRLLDGDLDGDPRTALQQIAGGSPTDIYNASPESQARAARIGASVYGSRRQAAVFGTFQRTPSFLCFTSCRTGRLQRLRSSERRSWWVSLYSWVARYAQPSSR